MRDALSNIQEVKATNQTLSGATPNNSQAFDVRGFSRARFTLQTNTVTAAGTTGFTIKLQHSDTLTAASFADVPASESLGTAPVITSNNDDDIIGGSLSYLGSKRYVRAVVTGSTSTNAVVHVRSVLTTPAQAAVAPIGTALATT
jgi:hypothetical protein